MNIAIILAGGIGSRMSIDIPKQFVELSGQMMIMHSMAPFADCDMVDNIQIVAAEEWRGQIEDAIFEDPESDIAQKFLGFSDPGDNRQLSIYNAMRDLQKMLECARENDSSAKAGGIHIIRSVIIHDAARPFVTVQCIEDCLKALDTHEGAMPVLPMSDTVYFQYAFMEFDGTKRLAAAISSFTNWTAAGVVFGAIDGGTVYKKSGWYGKFISYTEARKSID